MAHMVETMAYAGEVPWHGLGVEVPADLTPEQMLEKAGLDWTVDKVDLFYGDGVVVPGKKGLVRSSDGRYLDTIGDDWNPLQNRDAFTFFNDFVEAGDMEMHTAGSLEDGRRTWALAKVKDAFELFKGDVTENYLLFSNPHKYGQTITVMMTPVRVVCNNTISMALNRKTDYMVKINHRSEFDAESVKEMLGVAKEKLETYKEAAQFLGSKRFTNETLKEYFDRTFPRTSNKKDKEGAVSRNAQTALEVIDTQPGAKFAKGSWWQAFNTVTYMTDHMIGRSDDTRMTSAWFGSGRKVKENALKDALEFAEAA